MKSLRSLIVLFSALPAFLFAQEETLLGSGDIEHGGYGAPVIKFTSINKEFAVLAGARGGWIINHSFVIGFGGYGLANNIHSYITGPFGERFVEFGYGGLTLEYIFDSDRLLHMSISALIGGGAVRFRGGWDDDELGIGLDSHRPYDLVFVAEPGVSLDLNVIKWFRFSVGAEYRIVTGSASGVSNNKDLGGPSAHLMFRFGKF